MKTYEKSDIIFKWRLVQYRSPNGRLAITDWRKTLPIGTPRADLDTFLRDMAKRDKWDYPVIDNLRGEPYKGFTELRWKSCKVQHRIFGYELGAYEYLMLVGCTHKENYDPPGALETLIDRYKQIQRGEASYVEYQLTTNG